LRSKDSRAVWRGAIGKVPARATRWWPTLPHAGFGGGDGGNGLRMKHRALSLPYAAELLRRLEAQPPARPARALPRRRWATSRRSAPPAPPNAATHRPPVPRIPPGETGGPTFPPEPTLAAEPRSARWQGWPAGAFSAGHLRSPCQQEGAEGLGSWSAEGNSAPYLTPGRPAAECRSAARRTVAGAKRAARHRCPSGG